MSRNVATLARWAATCVAIGLLLEGLALADTLRGTLRSVDARTRRIVVTDRDGDDNRLNVAPAARITLNGKEATLDSLRPGDRVIVTFQESPDGQANAVAIAATRSKEQGTWRPSAGPVETPDRGRASRQGS